MKLSFKWSEGILLNKWKYLNCGTYLYLGIYKNNIFCWKENIRSFVSSFFGDHDWFFHKAKVIFSLMYHSLLNSMVVLVCRAKDYLTRDRIFKCTQYIYIALTDIRKKTSNCLSWIIKLAEWAHLIRPSVALNQSLYCPFLLLLFPLGCFAPQKGFFLSKRCIAVGFGLLLGCVLFPLRLWLFTKEL